MSPVDLMEKCAVSNVLGVFVLMFDSETFDSLLVFMYSIWLLGEGVIRYLKDAVLLLVILLPMLLFSCGGNGVIGRHMDDGITDITSSVVAVLVALGSDVERNFVDGFIPLLFP